MIKEYLQLFLDFLDFQFVAQKLLCYFHAIFLDLLDYVSLLTYSKWLKCEIMI